VQKKGQLSAPGVVFFFFLFLFFSLSSLRDLLWKICLCYLDDIIVFGRTPQELLERLRTVLDRLRDVGLKVKPSKCELFKTSIKFLGHLVSADGIDPLPEKIETIRNWPVPHCVRDVRAFLAWLPITDDS